MLALRRPGDYIWPVDERTRRISENEDLFRRVNEQDRRLNESFRLLTNDMTIVCECGEQSCIEQLTVSRPEYEAVRRDPRDFMIVPGHDASDVEDVIRKTKRYWLVRKRSGEPARIVELLSDS